MFFIKFPRPLIRGGLGAASHRQAALLLRYDLASFLTYYVNSLPKNVD